MVHIQENSVVFMIFLIFSGAALLSTFVLFTRQSLLVAYMLLGVILGPWGLKLVNDSNMVMQIGSVGITFLLFLLGLHLHPQNLFHMLKKATWVAVISSLIFVGISYIVCIYFGIKTAESLIVGAALMFSSTIIGLKLLPTTILHHKHTGEVMISVLLMQDLIAILVLLILHGLQDNIILNNLMVGVLGLPCLLIIAFLVERFVLIKLLARFDQIQEYIFLLSIGWCLGLSQLSEYLGLSQEIGAFIAGVSIAASPIALYIAESLKPLRDFFLVLFFFSIGASFDFNYLDKVLVPALILAGLILLVKPVSFYALLRNIGESAPVSKEVGLRLGQASEFSLLVASLAAGHALISDKVNYLIQATTIFTFVVSSYIIVLLYPTPLGLTERMRQD